MNPFQMFGSEKFGNIRAAIINEVPWFVGREIAGALGYVKTEDAIKRHVAKKDKKFALIPAITSSDKKVRRRMTIINESGLYSLVLSSKLPEAQAFKDWVTGELLPSVRKVGLCSPEQILDKLLESTTVETEPEKACVYVLRLSNGTVKIGVTADVLERARTIERQSGFKVERVYNSSPVNRDLALDVEKALHIKFANQRLEGEFFSVTFEGACREMERCLAERHIFEPLALPDADLADKLLAVADRMQNPDAKDKILIRVANLLIGGEGF